MNIVIVTDLSGLTVARKAAAELNAGGHCVKIVTSGGDFKDAIAIKPTLKKAKIKRALKGAHVIHFISSFRYEKTFRRIAGKMGIPTAVSGAVVF